MEEQQFDLVAIGDITTDAFIRLRDAEVRENLNHENRQICMSFGAKLPYESVTVVPAVGNSANAAVCASRLGLKSAMVTNLGSDRNGEEALESLKKNSVDTRWVAKHDNVPTNYHYVLWYHDDRTILVKHNEYPYALPDFPRQGSGQVAKWIYLSSLGENSLPFHHEIATYFKAHPEVKLAFQPGTFQIKLGKELKEIYELSEIFFCNADEAIRIITNDSDSNDTNITPEKIKELLIAINKLGPKIVVITDAKNGAYAIDAAGKIWFIPSYPDPNPPVDRTGAGDAFSSTVVSALVLGKTFPEALAWGPVNSMSVVQEIGAQKGLLSREQLEKYLSEAPADYQAREI